jgi:cell wall-associated NlpC family hydrolase
MNFGGNPGPASSDFTTGTDSKGVRGDVIRAGKSLLGADYVYGGGHGTKAGLSKSGMAHGSKTYGIDCSGLVRYAFAKAGLGQWGGAADAAKESTYGRSAPIKSLLPGDLVIKGGRGNAHHIAIYLGKGMILEAQQTGTTVHIRSIGNGSGFTGIHLDY